MDCYDICGAFGHVPDRSPAPAQECGWRWGVATPGAYDPGSTPASMRQPSSPLHRGWKRLSALHWSFAIEAAPAARGQAAPTAHPDPGCTGSAIAIGCLASPPARHRGVRNRAAVLLSLHALACMRYHPQTAKGAHNCNIHGA